MGTVEDRENGLLGANADGAKMFRSRFEGSVRGNVAVGGFVGGNYDSFFEVRSSAVRADVTGTEFVGGISGDYSYRAEYADSYFTGTLTGVGAQQASIGGFFGRVLDSGTASSLYVEATIETDAQGVGGFIGSRVWRAEIASSFAIASVSGSSPLNTVSWWIGEDSSGIPFMGLDSYSWSGATCTNRGGGTCTTGPNTIADAALLQDPSTPPLTQWDFANVWRAEPGGLPTLRLEQNAAPTFTAACGTVAIVDYAFSCPLTISDADVNELRAPMYTRNHTCEWLAARSSSLRGTPLMTELGTCRSEFYVSDGLHDSTTETVTVDVHAGFSIAPTATPDMLLVSFAGIAIGSTTTLTVTLTNREPVATMLGISLPAGPFDFAGGAFPGAGASCTSTVAPGASCTVALAFSPTSTAQARIPMTINFTAARGPVSYDVTLIGIGL